MRGKLNCVSRNRKNMWKMKGILVKLNNRVDPNPQEENAFTVVWK